MLHVQQHHVPSEEECEAAVVAVLRRYGWQLLGQAEFVDRIRKHVLSGSAPDAIRAATFVYSEALYIACSGNEGSERQNLGYSELGRWLTDVAYARYRDAGEDAVQQALLATFQRFTHCRVPGAFIMFALIQLRDAARTILRQRARELPSFGGGPADEPGERGTVADDGETPEHVVLYAELRERLKQCRVHFLRKHPRATAQFAALWLKYIDGLDDTEIARRLGKSVAGVHLLRTRGKQKLQAEPEWRHLAEDFDNLGGVT